MARILAIDDDERILSVYRRLLSSDHEVTLAVGGQAAMDLLAEDDKYDLILCDVMMPCASGVEVYEHLQRVHPGLEHRLVFISGGWAQNHEPFMASVPNLKVPKPFDPAKLFSAIHTVLSRTPMPG